MVHQMTVLLLVASGPGCVHSKDRVFTGPCDAVCSQAERASRPGPDQTLEQARLASIALAMGRPAVAEQALRALVREFQSAIDEGANDKKHRRTWTGDPSEHMMAFLYLGQRRLEQGDHAGALELAQAAIDADTGPDHAPYRADFVAAHVLAALAHRGQGAESEARQAIEHAIDALHVRELTDALAIALHDAAATVAEADEESGDRVDVAHALLYAALPAALLDHPRDAGAAIRAAARRAETLRVVLVDEPKRAWPDELRAWSRREGRGAEDTLDAVVSAWQRSWPAEMAARQTFLERDQAFLTSLLEAPPGAVVWLEAGAAPDRIATGRYGEQLQLVDRDIEDVPPRAWLDGKPLELQYLDSVAFQAMTRGSRRVDRFRRNQAVFKDASLVAGEVFAVSGDLVQITDSLDGQWSNEAAVASGALYLAAGLTWLAGALTNPAADTRSWDLLPDTLWLARIDAPAGTHTLTVGSDRYTLHLSEGPEVQSHVVPGLDPGGARVLGHAKSDPSTPLALPAGPLGHSMP